MNRRAFLGAAAGSVAAGLAGCLGGASSGGVPTNGDYPNDPEHQDGIPPQIGEKPQDRNVDTESFRRLSVYGETVTLAPISVVEYWYSRADTRFVDARPNPQYEHSHIYGAVNSPAQREATGGGIPGWPKDDRIVTYCGCPHHLSSIRAAGLQKAGFTNVFVIDEGFWAWNERGYPMAGESFEKAQSYSIDGRVSADAAGEYAWATAPATGQQEAAPIGDDGRYTLHLHFSGLTDATEIRVDTPEYTVTGPLGTLVSGVVTG